MRLSSPIYWSPLFYRWTMRRLYGDLLDQRYEVVSELIPEGARVVELCCGSGDLYEHLRRKNVTYHGFDLLPRMLTHIRRRGGRADVADVAKMTVPDADFVVMLGSLYHFHPAESDIVRRMANAGTTAMILEPVVNLSQSGNAIVRRLARAASFISGASSGYRLDAARLEQVLSDAEVVVTRQAELLGGRYRLVVFTRGRSA